MRARALITLSCMLLSTTSFADVVTVATDGSGDYTSIQTAIDAVPTESTILVSPGVYNEIIDLGKKSLVIEGTGKDATETVIDGSGFKSTVVRITGGQDESTIIRGLTVANGEAGSMLPGNPNVLVGGGMMIIDASPRIEFCRFVDNRSSFGGGVYLLRSTSAVADSVFLDNFAFADGGAIFASQGATRICRTILGNLANKVGGGVKSRFGFPAVTLEETIVCENAPDEIDGPYIDLGMNELCVCPADFTGNGEVDGADLGILVAFWGPCRSADCPADLNHDGIVNGSDLGLLLGWWGPCD